MPVFVTFRLSDALPQQVLDRLLNERDAFLAAHPVPWDEPTEACYHAMFSDKLDEYLDAGHGCCALRSPTAACIVADRLQHFNGQRYQLWSFVIMPNHVHVLASIQDGHLLPDVLKGWKGVSSNYIHKAGLCDLDPLWQPEYFDRLLRSPQHFKVLREYIRENPRKAHLKEDDYLLWERE